MQSQGMLRSLRRVDHRQAIVRQIELYVDRLACLGDRVVGRRRVVVRGVDLPRVTWPRGMRHPQEPPTVARPQVRLKPLEDGAVRLVVHELRLALEIVETRRGAEA